MGEKQEADKRMLIDKKSIDRVKKKNIHENGCRLRIS